MEKGLYGTGSVLLGPRQQKEKRKEANKKQREREGRKRKRKKGLMMFHVEGFLKVSSSWRTASS